MAHFTAMRRLQSSFFVRQTPTVVQVVAFLFQQFFAQLMSSVRIGAYERPSSPCQMWYRGGRRGCLWWVEELVRPPPAGLYRCFWLWFRNQVVFRGTNLQVCCQWMFHTSNLINSRRRHFGKEIIANRMKLSVTDPKVDVIWLKMYKVHRYYVFAKTLKLNSISGIHRGHRWHRQWCRAISERHQTEIYQSHWLI